MSNQQHTPEPWISEGSFVGIPNGKGTFYMVPLSGINQDRQEANARRIVACVNACAGIPTEALESEGSAVMGWNRTARKLIDVAKQRDELLGALEAFMRAPSIGSAGPGSSTIVVQEFNLRAAKAAIASVKGTNITHIIKCAAACGADVPVMAKDEGEDHICDACGGAA